MRSTWRNIFQATTGSRLVCFYWNWLLRVQLLLKVWWEDFVRSSFSSRAQMRKSHRSFIVLTAAAGDISRKGGSAGCSRCVVPAVLANVSIPSRPILSHLTNTSHPEVRPRIMCLALPCFEQYRGHERVLFGEGDGCVGTVSDFSSSLSEVCGHRLHVSSLFFYNAVCPHRSWIIGRECASYHPDWQAMVAHNWVRGRLMPREEINGAEGSAYSFPALAFPLRWIAVFHDWLW